MKQRLVVSYQQKASNIEDFDPEVECEHCASKGVVTKGSWVISGDPSGIGFCDRHLSEAYDEVWEVEGELKCIPKRG